MFLRRFKVTWTTGSTMSYGHILFLCCLVDSRVECSPDVGADIFTFGSQKMEVKTFVSLRPQRCFTYQYSENGVTPATCRYGESSTDGTMARICLSNRPFGNMSDNVRGMKKWFHPVACSSPSISSFLFNTDWIKLSTNAENAAAVFALETAAEHFVFPVDDRLQNKSRLVFLFILIAYKGVV